MERLWFPAAALALAVGLVVGAVVGVTVLAPADPASPPDPESPPYSYATATGCVPSDRVDSGWLTEAVHDRTRAVTFNYTLAHGADREVDATLSRSSPGRYRLALGTVPATDGKSDPPEDCTHGSTIQGGVALPADYETLTIAVDGTVVRTVENDGSTTARYWPLGGGRNASD